MYHNFEQSVKVGDDTEQVLSRLSINPNTPIVMDDGIRLLRGFRLLLGIDDTALPLSHRLHRWHGFGAHSARACSLATAGTQEIAEIAEIIRVTQIAQMAQISYIWSLRSKS